MANGLLGQAGGGLLGGSTLSPATSAVYPQGAAAPNFPVSVPQPARGWPSAEAIAPLNLTPQEQYLYQHHLDNLAQGKAVLNPDGSISTLRQLSVGHGGKTYNIPTVWDGQELDPKAAIARAAAEGWDKWPSYDSEDASGARYDQMHDAMARDVGAALTGMIPMQSGQ